MSGYLQRLLDRAAVGAPVAPAFAGARGARPAGLSQSPIAAMDQRLGDPGFADRDAGEAGSEAAPAEADTPVRAERTEAVVGRSRPETPGDPIALRDRAEPQAREPVQPILDPVEVEQESPAVAAPQSVPEHPMPIGQVFGDDLVLPEQQNPVAEPVAETTDQSQTATPDTGAFVEPVTPSETTTPLIAEFAPENPATRAPDVPTAVPEAPFADTPDPIHVAQESPQALFRLDHQVEPPKASPQPTENPEPAPVQLAEPPELIVPDLPAPAPLPEPPAQTAPPAPAPASPAPPQPMPEPATAQPRANRPMTAADASIIGPLPTRRRALTLFGNRRR